MDMNQFNKTVVRTETASEITFDVRPFGDQQGDAVDSYLHARLLVGQNTGIGMTTRLVVILCDAAAAIPQSAERWLAMLNAKGAPTEVRRA
jgi:hypothetical protein